MPVLHQLRGKTIQNYQPGEGIEEREDVVYRLRTNWDGDGLVEELAALSEEEGFEELTDLVIGSWGHEYDDDSRAKRTRDALLELAPQLRDLEALFWGDISYDECEVSWIENCDVGELVEAFPRLEHFGARGHKGLRLEGAQGRPLDHPNLKHLEVQGGGMSGRLMQDILEADLPELERLELWLGSSDYGFDMGLDDISPLLLGMGHPNFEYPFPKLKHLGLRNCELADDLAELLEVSSAIEQLETVDFSMGIMTERGARALLESAQLFEHLRAIDVSENWIQDEGLLGRLAALPIQIDTSSQRSDSYDRDWRYVMVGE